MTTFTGMWFLLALAASTLPTGSAPARLADFTQDLRRASGSFEQVVVDRTGHRGGASRGTFALEPPSAFRWEEAWPSPQLFINPPAVAGETAVSFGTAPGNAALLVRLLDSVSLSQDFTVYQTASHDGLVWLHLIPLSETADTAAVDLGFDEESLRRMNTTDKSGRVVELRFSGWKRNPTLPPETFRAAPPVDPNP